MNFTFEKILFLAVMLGVTAMSSRFGAARQDPPAAFVADEFSVRQSRVTPPVFMLSSPTVVSATPSSASVGEGETDPSPDEVALADLEATLLGELAGKEKTASPPPRESAARATVKEGSLVPTSTLQAAVFRPVGVVSEPKVAATAALLADLTTGEQYFGLAPLKRWPIASITKLMTAVAAFSLPEQKAKIALTEADFPPEDTSIGKKLAAGETYTASDLMTAMLVVSSNEAAEALANQSGNRSDFINRLNGLAAAWGLDNTHFGDPTGLSTTNQSNAYDLRRLATKIFNEYPQVFSETRRKQATITNLDYQKRLTLQNINAFADDPTFLGGKTGYTEDAGGNLLSIFMYQKRPIVVIVLGTEDRFGETEKLFAWFRSNFTLNR